MPAKITRVRYNGASTQYSAFIDIEYAGKHFWVDSENDTDWIWTHQGSDIDSERFYDSFEEAVEAVMHYVDTGLKV